MAAGNSLLEAIVYGLYEVIEHDIYACWETTAFFNQLRRVNIDHSSIQDEALQALVSDLTGRGHQVHFFNLINRYDIPMVLCALYESDREVVFSGITCRLNLQDAMTHSFHEALNGHFVTYYGSRDDRRGFEQESASTPLRFLEQFVGRPNHVSTKAERSQPLGDQLTVLLERLRQHGIEHAFAIDLSPRDEYQLSVAKVVVPGMDSRRAARRSPDFYRKCVDTHRLVIQFAQGDQAADEIAWAPSQLRQKFSLPLQRFFKA